MKKIIFNLDGKLCVMHPVRNTHPVLEDLSEEEIIARAYKGIPPEASEIHLVEESEIPTDRSFRDGWKNDKGKISHDLSKCRAIYKDRLRAERKPLLEKLDIDYIRALEAGDKSKIAIIKVKKQELRDAPQHPDIEQSSSVEDLKKLKLIKD